MIASQLIAWHCPTCKKHGSVFVPLPCEKSAAQHAVAKDHGDRNAICVGITELQSVVATPTRKPTGDRP
jgi:hypothetical protein